MATRDEPPQPMTPAPSMFDWPGQQAVPLQGAVGPVPTKPIHRQGFPAAPTPRQGGSNRALIVGLGLAMVAAIAIPVVIHQRSSADKPRTLTAAQLTPAQLAAAPYCGVAVTPDMAADTRAFVDASIASNSAQSGGSTTGAGGVIANLGNQQGTVTRDQSFLTALEAAPWSSPVRSANAHQLEDAVRNYDSALSAQTLSQGTTPSDDSDLRSALNQRLAADQGLRQQLGLPASTCAVTLPS